MFFLSRLSGFSRNTIVVGKIIYIVLKPAFKGGRYRIVNNYYSIIKAALWGAAIVLYIITITVSHSHPAVALILFMVVSDPFVGVLHNPLIYPAKAHMPPPWLYILLEVVYG